MIDTLSILDYVLQSKIFNFEEVYLQKLVTSSGKTNLYRSTFISPCSRPFLLPTENYEIFRRKFLERPKTKLSLGTSFCIPLVKCKTNEFYPICNLKNVDCGHVSVTSSVGRLIQCLFSEIRKISGLVDNLKNFQVIFRQSKHPPKYNIPFKAVVITYIS